MCPSNNEDRINYSEYQIRLLRARLQSYAYDSRPKGKKILQWEVLRNQILELTGVNIPTDSLRQNIMPSNKKKGKGPRTFTDPQRWAAIYAFLIDESVKYLSPSQFNEKKIDYGAAYALAEFISGTLGSFDVQTAKNLQGSFNAIIDADKYSEIKTLAFDVSEETGLIRVEELSVIENLDRNAAKDGLDEDEDETTYSGWAISAETGFLLIILKEASYGYPRCYLVLETVPEYEVNSRVSQLLLLIYDGVLSQNKHKILNNKDNMSKWELIEKQYLGIDYGKIGILLTRI